MAGAPIQLLYQDTPVQRGYARYPCIDFVQMYDFAWGCPVVAATNPSLNIIAGPYCWVIGTLPVRLAMSFPGQLGVHGGRVNHVQIESGSFVAICASPCRALLVN